MAQSPSAAERRAHTIREFARLSQSGRLRSSAPSSAASDHESQRAFDTESQEVPALAPHPDTIAPKPNLSVGNYLNSSVVGRAFPGFSVNGSSDDEASIEGGRGRRRSFRSSPSRDALSEALSEDVTKDMSFDIGDGHRYLVTATPPGRPRKTASKLPDSSMIARGISGKENHDPAPAKTTAFGSGSSDPGDHIDQNDRPPLAELNTQHDLDNSVPFNNKRGSRFADKVHSRINTTPKGKSLESVIQNATVNSAQSAANGTYQSFLLPDLPNITELVSGVRQDGTPLFHASIKSKSRFANSYRQRSHQLPSYAPLGDAAANANEQALYASLQLLQERVRELEQDKNAADKRAEECELELLQLRSRIEEQDTQLLGRAAEDATNTKDWDSEKSKMEQSIKSLQNRLTKANKRVSACEVTIQNMTKDREAADQQLAVANRNSKELRTEADGVRDEIEKIKSQLAKVTRKHEKKIERLTKQENELRGKIQRREKAVTEMSALTKDLWETRRRLEASASSFDVAKNDHASRPSISVRRASASGVSAISHASRADTEPIVNRPSPRRGMATEDFAQRGTQSRAGDEYSVPHTYNADLSKDSDFMSFMEGDEVSKLRRIVEHDRDRLLKTQGESAVRTFSQHTKVLSKSALKPTIQPENDASMIEDVTADAQTTHENTTGRLTSRRRGNLIDNYSNADMTSAIILPDITLHRQILEPNITSKQTASIMRPVPVSDRQAELHKDGEEHTMRPAQAPGLALATVLHALEGELSKLKKQLQQLERQYNQHDPSLGKRKRKIVFEKMQACLNLIELKSDQVYALYDVLEGQKAKDQTMREEQVETTLRDIGIDINEVNRRNGVAEYGNARVDDVDEDLDDDDNEELPWEGIETTGTQTMDSVRNPSDGSRKRLSTAY